MNTNKEPKEVDWSKQKPGTIGVSRDGNRYEFIAARCDSACFHSDRFGWANRHVDGRLNSGAVSKQDILLPWESQIAEGHNPDELTNAQVGEGWRLAKLDETIASPMQWRDNNEWKELYDCIDFKLYDEAIGTYRVPITKAKKRIPCGPEHFPPGTVVHCGNPLHHSHVCLYAGDELVAWGQHYSMKMLSEMTHWRRSTDFGKTWLPCYVETEE